GRDQTIRERGKQDRRDRITDAALAILLDAGLDALSMQAISERAGVSVPTVYNLVGNKDDVIVALFDRLGAVFIAEADALTDDPIERCFAIVDLFTARLGDHADVVRSLIRSGQAPFLASHRPVATVALRRSLASALDHADDRGALARPDEAPLAIDHLIALTAGSMLRWAASDESPDVATTRLRATVRHGTATVLGSIVVHPETVERHRVAALRDIPHSTVE
ncbi:MAG: TetR/AcrR family transcriptional regulator, partial [Acidimicrobiia bacterium]